MTEALRLAVALVILALLARVLRPAWRHRRLALQVWSGIRLRHVFGSAALLALVLSVAVTLLIVMPFTGFGLGSLIGLTGNAVFAPVEQVARGQGGGGLELAAVAGFLGVLLALLPWLAYVEERAFREGLEGATASQEIWRALRFGLVHLAMLIPLAAALAVGVAGYFYGRVYRRAYARAAVAPTTPPLARAEAILASTTWHVTFNSLVVVLLLLGLVLGR